jgi:hypothetical protein
LSGRPGRKISIGEESFHNILIMVIWLTFTSRILWVLIPPALRPRRPSLLPTHKFRHGHAVFGLLRAGTMADYKALSENMMHADIRTTDDTYAMLSSEEVRKRIAGLFSTTDQASQKTQPEGLGKMSNEQLSQMLVEVARRLAK